MGQRQSDTDKVTTTTLVTVLVQFFLSFCTLRCHHGAVTQDIMPQVAWPRTWIIEHSTQSFHPCHQQV